MSNAATAQSDGANPAPQDPSGQPAPAQLPLRVRLVDPPVGTQKSQITAEALKVPAVDLGAQLKATTEGVVVSSLVSDGLAARSKFEGGDVIESIGGRPVLAPGAVAYELHRHKAGSKVDVAILRGGKRITRSLELPKNHQPLLLNRNESFGEANNDAKDQGGSAARPIQVKPTEQSLKTLEEEKSKAQRGTQAAEKRSRVR